MTPKLSICIPTADDFARLHCCIQSLRFTHGDVMPDCELVVVINTPDTDQARETQWFCERINVTQDTLSQIESGSLEQYGYFTDARERVFGHGVRCVTYNRIVGTAAAKNECVRQARGDVVLVMDSHVQFQPGALAKLIEFAESHPDSRDLWHGPMMWDALTNGPSDMTTTWGMGGYGQWKDDPRANRFDADPFPILAMGTGVFACHRKAWLGFNPLMKGFGGEEMYLQQRYRKAGREALCLPFLRWWHSFTNVHGRNTPTLTRDKCWNYMIGLNELGDDLETVKHHFTVEAPAPELTPNVIEAFQRGIDVFEPNYVNGSNVWPDLQTAYQQAIDSRGDISEHLPLLRQMASQVSSVAEFGVRNGCSTRALLAGLVDRGSATRMRSFDVNGSLEAAGCVKLAGKCDFQFQIADSRDVKIEKTDLVFIDTKHTAEQLGYELWKHGRNALRWIVLHDTVTFGEKGEDGTPGLLPAVRYWLAMNRDWFVVAHYENNNGLTILGRQEPDKPAQPVALPQGMAMPFFPQIGPGTELKAMLDSIGVHSKPGCDCEGKSREMNRLGVAGCRAQFWTLVGWMKDGQDRWEWTEKLMVAARAVASGMAFQINWFDPFPDLVREAIRRAEKIEAEQLG